MEQDPDAADKLRNRTLKHGNWNIVLDDIEKTMHKVAKVRFDSSKLFSESQWKDRMLVRLRDPKKAILCWDNCVDAFGEPQTRVYENGVPFIKLGKPTVVGTEKQIEEVKCLRLRQAPGGSAPASAGGGSQLHGVGVGGVSPAPRRPLRRGRARENLEEAEGDEDGADGRSDVGGGEDEGGVSFGGMLLDDSWDPQPKVASPAAALASEVTKWTPPVNVTKWGLEKLWDAIHLDLATDQRKQALVWNFAYMIREYWKKLEQRDWKVFIDAF